MEDSNKIDKLLRERLQHAEVPAPDFVWPEVERRLHKKRRPFFFIWFLFGGLALAGAWAMWGNRKMPESALPSSAAALTAVAPEKSINMNSSGNVGEVRSEQASTTSLSAKQAVQIAVEEKASKQSDVSSAHAVTVSQARQISLKTPEEHRLAPVTIPSARAQIAETSKQDETVNAVLTSTEQASEQVSLEEMTAPEGGTTNTETGLTGNNAAIESLKWLDARANTAVYRGNSMLVIAPRQYDFKKNKSIIHRKKPNKHCYDFAKNSSVWMIDAYGGPSLAHKKLSARTIEDRPYLNQRLNTEQNSLSLNAGLRASYLFQGNLMLRTGVQYELINEIFEYKDPSYTIYTIKVNPNGQLDTIGVYYGANYQKTFNRLGFLEIPLQAGFELRRGRGGMSLNGGLSFNVLFKKRGAMLTPQGDAAYFTPGKKGSVDVFRPNVGMSIMGSVQWFYHLQPRTRVFIEPYYRNILNPVSLLSHPLEQKYGIGGLRMGITKLIN